MYASNECTYLSWYATSALCMCNLVLFVHHKYVSPQIAKMQDKDFEAKDVG